MVEADKKGLIELTNQMKLGIKYSSTLCDRIPRILIARLDLFVQEELMKFRNFGQKSLSEIEQMLIDRGLSFGMDLNRLNLRD